MEDKNPADTVAEAILDNQNQEVDDMCGCPGKEKTRSNRVHKKFHEDWCFYYMHVEDQVKKMVEERGWTSEQMEIKARQLRPGERFRFAKYETGRRPALLIRLTGDTLLNRFGKEGYIPVCNVLTGVVFNLNENYPVIRERELYDRPQGN